MYIPVNVGHVEVTDYQEMIWVSGAYLLQQVCQLGGTCIVVSIRAPVDAANEQLVRVDQVNCHPQLFVEGTDKSYFSHMQASQTCRWQSLESR